MNVSPAGRRSVTVTPVAASGPPLLRVTVNVMVSPTFGEASLTLLLRARSACCGVSVALAVLLPGLGSTWSARSMAALFVLGAGLTTCAWIIRVCGVPATTVPTFHRPVRLA
jgi:hypothetical protein